MIVTTSNTPAGVYNITVTGISNDGGAVHSAIYQLTITDTLPYVEAGSPATEIYYCGVGPGEGKINFSWVYKDDENDSQTSYEFQVATDLNFNNKVIDAVCNTASCLGGVNSPNTDTKRVEISPTPLSDELAYGQTYYWRIKVCNKGSVCSNWTAGPSFTTPVHAYPWPDFDWFPKLVGANSSIKFFDNNSTCYNPDSYNCSTHPENVYEWDFSYNEIEGFADPAEAVGTEVFYSFPAEGVYNVALRITDPTVGSCITSKNISVSKPLPKWREVSPISWLRNFLANLSSIF
jgi:hypothetical protein